MNPITQAVVLVGGRGTRLGEITRTIPKPMLPIGGRPFLEYLITFLLRNGINRVLFCISHLGEVIQEHFGAGEKCGIKADYSCETSPLGTGGALWLAREKLDERFVVLNGDTIFDIPLRRLIELLARSPASHAAMALRSVDNAGRYGSVQVEGDLVRGFEEKGRTGPGLINGGIYCLTRQALEFLPPGESSLERVLFPQLAANRQLCAKVFDGYFLDIGLPETLARGQSELPALFSSDEAERSNS